MFSRDYNNFIDKLSWLNKIISQVYSGTEGQSVGRDIAEKYSQFGSILQDVM